jgi:hypothetical protein
MKLPELPSVKLSNGLVVANYSSPHPFTFVDGSVLPACSKERATLTKLIVVEDVQTSFYKDPMQPKYESTGKLIRVEHVKLNWQLTWFSKAEIDMFVKLQQYEHLPWHIVLVTLPFMTACKEYMGHAFKDDIVPFRVIHVADKITKEVHINKFYVV